MESCGKVPYRAKSLGWQACSACAGDYEDPDRTAGLDEEDSNGSDVEETEGMGRA